MMDNLLALAALADQGSMHKAALSLHITQSAVSKRISNLQYQLNKKLIEPRGRKVELTPLAFRLLERARPLMAELKELFIEEQAEASGTLVIDISVSVLLSGGAKALARVKERLPQLQFQVSAYHASVAVERVRSGESVVALVQGTSQIAPELSALPVFEQEVVIVPSALKPFKLKSSSAVEVLAMEERTEAWAFISKGIKELNALRGIKIVPKSRLQSFSAIAELARAGFGHGLVPHGVARALNIPDSKIISLPDPKIKIPVSLIGRQSTLARPMLQKFYAILSSEAQKI